MKITLPKLSAGLIVIYLLPALFFGMYIDDLAQKFSAFSAAKNPETKTAYASSLPDVNSMTVEQHFNYLRSQYTDCGAGQNYLDIITLQHQSMPLESSLEVSMMMQTLCENAITP